MFIDLHIIQSIPLANLNRDDAGSPKTMPYGGVKRLRVSSQSWKRATRQALETHGLADLTYRSRHADVKLQQMLADHAFGDEAESFARWVFLSGLRTVSDKENVSVLLYASDDELRQIVELVAPHQEAIAAAYATWVDGRDPDDQNPSARRVKKGSGRAKVEWDGPPFECCEVDYADRKSSVLTGRRLTAILSKSAHADAIGLFGRMLADNPSVDIDAAVQVAHAFSVHPAAIEFDYFTAVEDIPSADEGAGAAMVETGEFASGTLYRNAVIDVDELVANCGGDRRVAAALAEAFVKAFALSIPSGKKNSTAPNSVPALVAAAVREDRPVSYAAAFEKPIASTTGYERLAVERLDAYAGSASKMVETPLFAGVVNLTDVDTAELGIEVRHVNDLAAAATEAI